MKKASRKDNASFYHTETPLLIVLSGPSGAGKDAVLSGMREAGVSLEYIVTVTTRTKRAKEISDIDYHFVYEDEFRKMVGNDELLEYAQVYGNWYGTPKQPVKQALDNGRDVIVKVDTQGAASIKSLIPQSVLIFLTPASHDELAERLEHRHTETPFDLALRIKTAEAEIKQLPLYDYVILSKQDEFEAAVSDIKAIITAEKHRVNPRQVAL